MFSESNVTKGERLRTVNHVFAFIIIDNRDRWMKYEGRSVRLGPVFRKFASQMS